MSLIFDILKVIHGQKNGLNIKPVALLVTVSDYATLRSSCSQPSTGSENSFDGIPVHCIAGLKKSVALQSDGTVVPL